MGAPVRSKSSARLITPRLLLRPRQRADLDAQVALDSDPEISIYSDVDVLVRSTGRSPREVRKRIKAEIAGRSPSRAASGSSSGRSDPGFSACAAYCRSR